MPVWAYIYCGFTIILCFEGLFDKARDKQVYFIIAELLACFSGIAVFLIAFQVLKLPHGPLISTICFVYAWLWGFYAYWPVFEYQKFRAEYHERTSKSHTELVNKIRKNHQAATEKGVENLPDIDDLEDSYDYERTEKTALIIYVVSWLIGIALILPYFYAYLLSIGLLSN